MKHNVFSIKNIAIALALAAVLMLQSCVDFNC